MDNSKDDVLWPSVCSWLALLLCPCWTSTEYVNYLYNVKLFQLLSLCLDKRGAKELSEEEHYERENYEHNAQYDHEAFLGKDEAQSFDKLPHEEAKRRLG